MDLPASLERFVPRHDTLWLKLRETAPEALTGSPVGYALQVLQAEDAPRSDLEHVLSGAVTGLEAFAETQQAEWRRAMQYLLQLIRHRRAVEEQDALFSVVTESVRSRREEVEEMATTGAQALWAQGRKEGREEGRMRQIEMLLELLEARLGPLPVDLSRAIEALPAERISLLFRKALTAVSLAQLDLGD